MASLGTLRCAGPCTTSSCAQRQRPASAVRFGSTDSQLVRVTLGSSYLRGSQVVVFPKPTRNTACGAVGVQMNLFSRVARIFRSYANNLVSSAEDPEKLLDQTVEDMQNDLIKMRQASAQVMASQKQLEAKYSQMNATAEDWYKRAELALRKGDEELAREALSRHKGFKENANAMLAQLNQQKKATDTLIANTRMLESKLVEAKSKKDTLKARAKSAATSRQINEMIQGLNTSNAVTAFERMEEKVMSLEAESDAALQLAAPDDLEAKFARLEGGVDDDLEKLKREMLGSSRPKASLPEGRPIRDAIDFELEELRRKARE